MKTNEKTMKKKKNYESKKVIKIFDGELLLENEGSRKMSDRGVILEGFPICFPNKLISNQGTRRTSGFG